MFQVTSLPEVSVKEWTFLHEPYETISPSLKTHKNKAKHCAKRRYQWLWGDKKVINTLECMSAWSEYNAIDWNLK